MIRTIGLAAGLAISGCGSGAGDADDRRELPNASAPVARPEPAAEPHPRERPASPAKQSRTTGAAGLCGPAEEIIFQCGVGERTVALCSGGARGSPAHVQYRYGTPARIELAYPREPASGPGSLSWASAGYSGGGEAQVRFASGGHEYVIYSRIVRTGFGPGGNDPQEEAGLFVRKGSRLVSQQRCKGAGASGEIPQMDLAKAQALLPEGEMVYPDE